MLAVLPLLAMVKWTFDFFQLKLSRAPWVLDDGVTHPVGSGAPPAEAACRPQPMRSVEFRPGPSRLLRVGNVARIG